MKFSVHTGHDLAPDQRMRRHRRPVGADSDLPAHHRGISR